MNKLRELLNSYGRGFGDTENGKAWCIKALHPSDPLTDVRGVPDQTCMPTTVLNYQQQYGINAPTANKKWECEIYLLSDPVRFATIFVRDVDGGNPAALTVLNQKIADPGDTEEVKGSAWISEMMRWRLAYAGTTVYLDAPALANEGTVVAAQTPVKPRFCPLSITETLQSKKLASAAPNALGVTSWLSAGVSWGTDALPEYAELMAMPNSYTGEAKNGVYMPLRLDSNHALWHDARDAAAEVKNTDGSLLNDVGQLAAVQAASAGVYAPAKTFQYDAATIADWHLLPCVSNMGCIAFRNLSSTASLMMACRLGFEVQVLPRSMYSPYLHISPAYDRLSLETYWAISRELKDAYPADYNDLGKLWDVIKRVAGFAAPIVRMIPGVGPAVEAIARPVGAVLDKVVGATNKRDKPPAASTERVEETARRSLAAPVRK